MSVFIELMEDLKSEFFFERYKYVNDKLNSYGLDNYDVKLSDTLPNEIEPSSIQLSRWVRKAFKNLKIIAIELEYNPKWTPQSDSLLFDKTTNYTNEILSEIFGKKQSHLILHSQLNGSGYYVPVDFKNIYVPDRFLNTLGSSISLRNELKKLANQLKFDLGTYSTNFDSLYDSKVDELFDKADILADEKLVLLVLYHMSLASIKYNLLITFS